MYLSKSDIDRLTSFLKLSTREFLDKYCRPVAWRGKWIVSLQEKINFDCIFWDQGCTVYNARPVQCSTYPFWDSLLSNSQAWNAESSACPGINKGKNHSYAEIQYQVNLQRSNKPLVLDSLSDWYELGV